MTEMGEIIGFWDAWVDESYAVQADSYRLCDATAADLCYGACFLKNYLPPRIKILLTAFSTPSSSLINIR